MPLQKRTESHAFTLVELMVSIVVLGVISIALTALMVSSARSMRWSVNKSLITNDFRQFTQQISQDAINASHAYLYPSFGINVVNDDDNQLTWGESGDCLVLITVEPSDETDLNSPRVYRSIVVYNREPGVDGEEEEGRPVFRRERIGLNIPVEVPLETVLNNQRDNFDPPETVLQLSRGLSENQLFYRATIDTFIINGEIIHGNNVQRVTNTYNLTISTRG